MYYIINHVVNNEAAGKLMDLGEMMFDDGPRSTESFVCSSPIYRPLSSLFCHGAKFCPRAATDIPPLSLSLADWGHGQERR